MNHVWIPSYRKRGESRLKLKPIAGAKAFTDNDSCRMHIDYVKRGHIHDLNTAVKTYLKSGYIVQPAKFERAF